MRKRERERELMSVKALRLGKGRRSSVLCCCSVSLIIGWSDWREGKGHDGDAIKSNMAVHLETSNTHQDMD